MLFVLIPAAAVAVIMGLQDPAPQAQRADTVVADTPPPAIPDGFCDPRDRSRVVTRRGDPGDKRYRHIMDVMFAPQASGLQIRALLSKYSATILGGMPFIRAYTLQFPDPGSLKAADSLRLRLREEPGVTGVRLKPYQQPPLSVQAAIESTVVADTTTPPRPTYYNDRDSSKVGRYPGATEGLVYRNIIDVLFEPTATGATIRYVLAKYHGEIVGGWHIRVYTIRIPDPGSVLAGDRICEKIRQELGVAGATLGVFRSPAPRF